MAARRSLFHPSVASVLIFEEKHGNRYFHVSNDKELQAASLQVLTDRHKAGCWYPKPEESDVKPSELDKLPASLQKAVNESWSEYSHAMRDYNQEVVEYKTIDRAVRDKDGEAAWNILNARKDAEYEGLQLEPYEEVRRTFRA